MYIDTHTYVYIHTYIYTYICKKSLTSPMCGTGGRTDGVSVGLWQDDFCWNVSFGATRRCSVRHNRTTCWTTKVARTPHLGCEMTRFWPHEASQLIASLAVDLWWKVLLHRVAWCRWVGSGKVWKTRSVVATPELTLNFGQPAKLDSQKTPSSEPCRISAARNASPPSSGAWAFLLLHYWRITQRT
jgi:hypothetical protein